MFAVLLPFLFFLLFIIRLLFGEGKKISRRLDSSASTMSLSQLERRAFSPFGGELYVEWMERNHKEGGSRAAKAWHERGEALLACADRRRVEMEVEFHLLM
jgi:hypothetical protein